MPLPTTFDVSLPAWIGGMSALAGKRYPDDASRVALTITLSARNVAEGTGGPFGAAIIETDTGRVELRRFFGVDDAGVRVNPRIVEGQLHGGIAAGVGQVLGETMRYDEDGNPLTTTFADYLLPAADQLPMFDLEPSSTATSFNQLGVKGVGESGIVGAVPAVHNAVVDALSHLGVKHVDLPCTPERVWRAIEEARMSDRASADDIVR